MHRFQDEMAERDQRAAVSLDAGYVEVKSVPANACKCGRSHRGCGEYWRRIQAAGERDVETVADP